DDKIAWYENDGSESFTAHTITTSAGHAHSVYAVDVDGDGDIDVLSASVSDDKIAWYENIIPPSPFDLVYPLNDTTIILTRDNFLDTLYFAWNQSVDPGGDEVTYRREMTGDLPEYIRFIVESNEQTTTNMYKVPYHHIEHYMHEAGVELISGTWTIIATDGEIDVYAENGPFTLTIDGSKLNIADSDIIPETFALHGNYPNPFNPTTTISYDLPKWSQVTLGIYDLLGKQIKTLVNQSQDAGNKIAMWDGTDEFGRQVSAGVYLYQIKAGEFTQTRKMLLLK
ncbi:MAG: T9SS type A sorting domain-containing protein, partial [Candidatus Marinimicrobia bacterium]|nr:T9SS type A sorting domain-containing protein [Candidatus Neomarinimicrobiota bacterium]